MLQGIVSSSPSLTVVPDAIVSTIGQRYLVKPHRAADGYRTRLEVAIADYLELDQSKWSVFAVSKGVNALRLALRAICSSAERMGAEVLMPAVTVPATAEAALMEGLRPVLVDVDGDSWHLDLDQAQAVRSERTVAIISVDWLGTPVDANAMRHFASKNRIAWISDSAQSFGSTSYGRPTGSNADATIFSTGYPKVFHTAGRGGLLIVSNRDAHRLHNDPTGLLRHEIMPEINAAFGLCLLPSIKEMVAQRRQAAQVYRDYLGKIGGLRFQKVAPASQPNAYQISVAIDESEFAASPRELADALAEAGIEASAQQVQNLSLLPQIQKYVQVPKRLVHAQFLHHGSLTLPISNHIDRNVCERVCDTVKSWSRA